MSANVVCQGVYFLPLESLTIAEPNHEIFCYFDVFLQILTSLHPQSQVLLPDVSWKEFEQNFVWPIILHFNP